jgi:hypothetical protein
MLVNGASTTAELFMAAIKMSFALLVVKLSAPAPVDVVGIAPFGSNGAAECAPLKANTAAVTNALPEKLTVYTSALSGLAAIALYNMIEFELVTETREANDIDPPVTLDGIAPGVRTAI